MAESVYREPDEKTPQPAPPKPPGRMVRAWVWYIDGWRAHTFDWVLGHILGPILAACAGWGVKGAITNYRDPCAVYVLVPKEAQTLKGSTVTIQVEECLWLKEGR